MHPFSIKEKYYIGAMCVMCSSLPSSYGYTRKTHCEICKHIGMINFNKIIEKKGTNEIEEIALLLCDLKHCTITLSKRKNFVFV